MKILYFGIYSKGKEYSRNNNLIRGLRLHGIEIVEAHFNLLPSHRHRMRIVKNILAMILFGGKLIVSYIVLAWKYFKLGQFDAIIVGYPGYLHIHLLRLLSCMSPTNPLVLYDVFIPLYDAIVIDRNLFKEGSIVSRILHRFESICCKSADICLIDTKEHCKYLIKEFGLLPERVCSIYVGSTIAPAPDLPVLQTSGVFRVLYVGTYIPLHGVDIILKAAKELEKDSSIHFTMIGRGQLKEKSQAMANKLLLTNVTFQDWVSPSLLRDFIRLYDLSMGIFGTTPKASRVIPSKIYDICSSGVPFITADTPAIREVFSHKKNAYFVPAGDAKALADAIHDMKQNHNVKLEIAKSAFELSKSTFSLSQIGKELINIIQKNLS